MSALEEMKARTEAALLHQVLDPSDYAEMAWGSVADASKLIAALEAVEDRLRSAADLLTYGPGGVLLAGDIRRVVAEALA